MATAVVATASMKRVRFADECVTGRTDSAPKRMVSAACALCMRTCPTDPYSVFRNPTTRRDAFLCDACASCQQCNRSLSVLDALCFIAVKERFGCTHCSFYCNYCGIYHRQDDFQDAYGVLGMQICAKRCCACHKLDDALLRHPHSDRAYCESCVVAVRVYPGTDNAYDDVHDWDELEAAVFCRPRDDEIDDDDGVTDDDDCVTDDDDDETQDDDLSLD